MTIGPCVHRERGTPVVSENWIVDSIQKKEAQPLDAYDIVSDLVPEGKGLPLDKLDPSEEAIETLTAEVNPFALCIFANSISICYQQLFLN
jgi:hypothetical protein